MIILRASNASDLCKCTERMIIQELTEALMGPGLSPSFLHNHLQRFRLGMESNILPIFDIPSSSDQTERMSESKPISPDWSPFPSMGFNRCHSWLPKHLIVDTVEWSHNTDQHDGRKTRTNPAVLLPALNSCVGEARQGRGRMCTLLCLFVSSFCAPSPLLSQAGHLPSRGALPKMWRLQIQHLHTYRNERN